MEKLLVQLTPEQIAPILQHLEEVVAPTLVNDVSNYAVGRQRIWLPYEAPLSNSRPWQLGIDDPKLWQWICYICETHAGFTPDVALVAKGGQIKPHRDTSYADYRAIGINLGPVVWGYQRQRTAYANMPQDDSAEKVEIELQGGEVFEFNSKNIHWTRDADPNRWSINVWQVKGGEQKSKFVAFKKSLAEGPTVSEAPTPKSSGKEENMKAYNIHWTTGPKAGTTEKVYVTNFMEVVNMVKDSGHAGQIKKSLTEGPIVSETPAPKPSDQEEKKESVMNDWTADELAAYHTGVCPHTTTPDYDCGKCDDITMFLSEPFYVMGTGSRSLVIAPKEVRMEVKAKLIIEIEKLKTRYPNLVLISGMAEGWDELIARAAVELKVPFIAMVPTKDYGSYYWGKNSLLKQDRSGSFNDLLSKAQKVIYLEEIYGRQMNLTKILVESMKAQGNYGPKTLAGPNFIIDGRLVHANFARNQAMVDMCNAALVYDSGSAGTSDAVERLEAAKKPYKVYPFTNPGGGDDGNKPVIEPSGGGMFQLTYKNNGNEVVETFGTMKDAIARRKVVGNGVIKKTKDVDIITAQQQMIEEAVQKSLAPKPVQEKTESTGPVVKSSDQEEKEKKMMTCKGIKKDGAQCTRSVKDGELCWQHTINTEEVQEMDVTYDIDEIMERLAAGQPITWMEDTEWCNLDDREPAPTIYISNNPTPQQLLNYRISFTENTGVRLPDDRWMFAVNTGAQRYPFLERLSMNGVKFTIRVEDTANLNGPVSTEDEQFVELEDWCGSRYNLAWTTREKTFFMDIHGVKPSNHFDWSLIGIEVKDVKKLTKRLAEITRLVFSWSHKVRDDRILIKHPDNEQLKKLFKGDYDVIMKAYDGMNLVRRSIVSKAYAHDHRVMVRYIGYEYMVKGDCFIIDDDILDAAGLEDFDFIVHPENVKGELKFIQTGKWRRRPIQMDGREVFINKPMFIYWRHHPIHTLRYDSQLSINNPAVVGLPLLERDLKLAMEKIAEDASKGILPNQQYVMDEEADLHKAWEDGLLEMASEQDRRRSALERWVRMGLDPRAIQSVVFFAMNGVVKAMDKSLVPLKKDGSPEHPMAGFHQKFNVKVANGFRALCSAREMFTDYLGVDFPTPSDKAFYDERYGMVWPAQRFIETFRLHGTHDHDDAHGYVVIKLWDDFGTKMIKGKRVNRVAQLKQHGVLPKHLVIPGSEDEAITLLYVMRSPNGSGEYSIMDFDFSTWPEEIELHDDLVPTIGITDLPRPIDEVLPANMAGLTTSRVYTKRSYTKDLFMVDLDAQMSNPGFGQICNILLFHSHITGGDIPPFMPDELGNIVDATQQGADKTTFIQIKKLAEEYKKYIARMNPRPAPDVYMWRSRGTTVNNKLFQNNFKTDWRDFDKLVYAAAIRQLKVDITKKYSFYMRDLNHTVQWVKKVMAPRFTRDQLMKMANFIRQIDEKNQEIIRRDEAGEFYRGLPQNKYTHSISTRNKRLEFYAMMDDVIEKFLIDKNTGEPVTDEVLYERVMMLWVAILTPQLIKKDHRYGCSDFMLAFTNTDGVALMDYLPAALAHFGYTLEAEVG